MQKKIPYFRQKKVIKENNYSEAFRIIYHISLFGGIALSIFYFAFVANVLPIFKDISQLISYLVAIFSVTIIFCVFLSGLFILPSILLNSVTPTREEKDKFPKIFFYFFIISQAIIILIMNYIQYDLSSLYKDNAYLFCIAAVSITIVLFIKNKIIMDALRRFAALFNGFALLCKTKEGRKKLRRSLLIFMYPIVVSLLTQIPLIFLVVVGFLDTKNFEVSIVLYTVAVGLTGIVLVGANKLFLDNVNLDNFQGIKQSFRYLVLILFITTLFISVGYMVAKKVNPIVVKPFEILKLGYYEAEIYFKKDFIEKSNPFILNETNQTNNTFFVWSSIGDEYIIQEIAVGYPVYENNKTFITIDVNKTAQYKYNEQNVSELYEVSVDKNTSALVANSLLKKYKQNQTESHDKIYRIKKENVDTEIVGSEIPKTTVWFKK